MSQLLGEFDCKLDGKGRLAMPAGLLRQLGPQERECFVINRGFEQHLVLYPLHEWATITEEINRLNLYVRKNRDFVRYFYRGATELRLDASNRLLLPKRLLEYAAIDDETVLFAYGNRVEVWARHLYDSLLSDEPEDFADLAEEIMGNRHREPPA